MEQRARESAAEACRGRLRIVSSGFRGLECWGWDLGYCCLGCQALGVWGQVAEKRGRERKKERERATERQREIYILIYVYIYTYAGEIGVEWAPGNTLYRTSRSYDGEVYAGAWNASILNLAGKL